MLELKLHFDIILDEFEISFNRTMLELKYDENIKGRFKQNLLIVPCWNWNKGRFRKGRLREGF